MFTRAVRIDNPFNYGRQEFSDVSSSGLLSKETDDKPTLLIRLSIGSTTNTTTHLSAVETYNTRTSKKIDNEEIKGLVSKILSFSDLDNNWDGYGGEMPSKQAVYEAIILLKFFPRNALPTRVGLSGDGEISLIWDTRSLFADFGVVGDGKFSYFIKDNEGKLYGDDLRLSNKLSHEVVNRLMK
ncbi:MAG: hypothetical protein KZQ77_13560 [Candidatus Thiodiazotropha sp. (ex Notomyrtea botanica)]|nr:hypothetical protein [Candidatus Thiodiazotropha sp. (ex Notomyrtea botanica)]